MIGDTMIEHRAADLSYPIILSEIILTHVLWACGAGSSGAGTGRWATCGDPRRVTSLVAPVTLCVPDSPRERAAAPASRRPCPRKASQTSIWPSSRPLTAVGVRDTLAGGSP